MSQQQFQDRCYINSLLLRLDLHVGRMAVRRVLGITYSTTPTGSIVRLR